MFLKIKENENIFFSLQRIGTFWQTFFIFFNIVVQKLEYWKSACFIFVRTVKAAVSSIGSSRKFRELETDQEGLFILLFHQLAAVLWICWLKGWNVCVLLAFRIVYTSCCISSDEKGMGNATRKTGHGIKWQIVRSVCKVARCTNIHIRYTILSIRKIAVSGNTLVLEGPVVTAFTVYWAWYL